MSVSLFAKIEPVGLEEFGRVLCRNRICSHRKVRPCEYHQQEAKILVKYLKEAGLEVTRRP